MLRTQGLESEAPLAFAALHRLLRPVLDHMGQLPAPQAKALRIAFGQAEGPAVEPFLVALATLSMLTGAAEEQTVVCVIDDAHWLDAATTDALLFTARRLDADRLVMLFAARDTDVRVFRPEGIPTLALGGLDPVSVRALLAETAGTVAVQVSDRLLAETGGNPLALVELPTTLTAGQLNGTAPLPPHLLLTSSVEGSFLERFRRLPDGAQTLMLVAVADDTGRLSTEHSQPRSATSTTPTGRHGTVRPQPRDQTRTWSPLWTGPAHEPRPAAGTGQPPMPSSGPRNFPWVTTNAPDASSRPQGTPGRQARRCEPQT